MTPQEYIEATGRTESEETYANLVRALNRPGIPERLLDSLVMFCNYAKRLDTLKAIMFYGRTDYLKDAESADWRDAGFDPVSDDVLGRLVRDEQLQRHLHMIIGMAGEAGEVADHLIDALRSGRGPTHIELVKEMGDLSWYMARELDNIDVTFEEAWDVNVSKLKARYPDKFTSEAANNRDTDQEDATALRVVSERQSLTGTKQTAEEFFEKPMHEFKGAVPPQEFELKFDQETIDQLAKDVMNKASMMTVHKMLDNIVRVRWYDWLTPWNIKRKHDLQRRFTEAKTVTINLLDQGSDGDAMEVGLA